MLFKYRYNVLTHSHDQTQRTHDTHAITNTDCQYNQIRWVTVRHLTLCQRTAAHDMHIAVYILFHLLSAEAAPAEPSWGGGMEAFSSVSSFVRASRHSPLP